MSQSTRPVLGHLTELWTPPASCLSLVVFSTTPLAWQTGYQGVTCGSSGGFHDASNCWPPTTANAPKPQTGFLSGWGFYSPGTLCPSGFTTACVATYDGSVSGDWKLQFTLTTGETAAGCCPSGGYSCYFSHPNPGGSNTYSNAQTCLLLATSTTLDVSPCTAATAGVASQSFSAVLPYTTTITESSATSTSVITSLEALAPLIQINWRAEDISTAAPTPTTSSSTPVPTNTDQGGSLSGGAIAGIVIGTVLGLSAIAIGIFWFMRKRRTRRTDASGQGYKPAGQQHSQLVKSQQETQQLFELPTTGVAHEMPTTYSAQELPGNEGVHGRFRAEVQG